ncbi:2-hydroxymuconic semialdehyde hydrolase [Enterococcus sp. MJM12]|uniref:2-hydroxymuconic semialdehyde hydrolase n=1 Tax=Candidatus Enterococcus myersii TaxID=2815322 RepID=A0ABS3H782_9ENTE|nr:2-hydroxymuconic semialdehyde hydrolase [Enterococcus sp. MJM12]MBO0449315.1 2-hydroxymuconic semialdehyde hydrolase [Enterococcus sp. MJM12]
MNENYILPVNNLDDVWELHETETFYSVFCADKNIDVEMLRHLIDGGALIDVSDGEYIHWLQLTDEAKLWMQNVIKSDGLKS